MKLVVVRKLPDGRVRTVFPFHMSLEGTDTFVLCRDAEDFDAAVKVMCMAAWRSNVLIVIYSVVSNHCRAVVLSESMENAVRFGEEVKRVYSMWLSRRYKVLRVMRGTSVKVIPLTDCARLRDALAFFPRCENNPWSGFGAMFSSAVPSDVVRVSDLSRRDLYEYMHTGSRIKGVPWLLDASCRLVPQSFCDREYLEQAFDNDRTLWLQYVEAVDRVRMRETLIDTPRESKRDMELSYRVNLQCMKWYGMALGEISLEQKCRILPYMYRTSKTTVSQLARVFSMDPERVKRLLCQ